MLKRWLTILSLGFISLGFTQSIQELIDTVDITRLESTVAELSGERPVLINGESQTITTRVQNNNNLAADYIKSKFETYPNLVVEFQEFNSQGKNIIATQIGQTNPNNIYLICAHYDSVAEFCADDNATGTAAVLEIARILSTQCMDNTIVYAIWDEEEIGLLGAKYYAEQAANTGNGNERDNILAVINMDMMGYDGDAPGTDGDNEFDIDVRPVANSLEIVTDLETIMSSYTFNLKPIIVNPGTPSSDHKAFWDQGYSAVLVGESWETDDQTPFYHTVNDKLETLDLGYFLEITKLVMAYTATKGGIQLVDSSVSVNGPVLSVSESNATYQWYNCDLNLPIENENNQSFSPSADGNYAVEISKNGCVERSDCLAFNVLGLENFNPSDLNIYTNKTDALIIIDSKLTERLHFKLYNSLGKLLIETDSNENRSLIKVGNYETGLYFLNVSTKDKSGIYKVIIQN